MMTILYNWPHHYDTISTFTPDFIFQCFFPLLGCLLQIQREKISLSDSIFSRAIYVEIWVTSSQIQKIGKSLLAYCANFKKIHSLMTIENLENHRLIFIAIITNPPMKLARPKARLNDSVITLATETSELANSKIIRRRNSEINTSIEKKRKTNYETNAAKICYIPSNKISISLSQSGENSISLPNSRQSSKEHINPYAEKEAQNTRRFQRNTERVYDSLKNATIDLVVEEECNIEECLQQKRQLKRNIEGLKIKYEKSEKQKTRLLSQLEKLKDNLKANDLEINRKNAKISELETALSDKQKKQKQHLQNLFAKDQQIIKLDRFIEHLKSKINSLPKNKSLNSPCNQKNTLEMIAKLSNQIKYKQIEVHMLKKDKYDFSAMQQQVKTLTTENKQLKGRISQLVRAKRRMYMEESSQSSVSLNLSEVSPDKKKSSYRR